MTALTSLFTVRSSVMPRECDPLLSITRGLHQGCHLTLDRAIYTVGSSASADLIIGDPGVAELHVVLRFVAGRVAVEALGDDVLVIGAQGQEVRVPKGSGHRTRLPLEIGIGGALMRLGSSLPAQMPEPERPRTWHNKRHWLMAMALMFLCVGAFAFRGEQILPDTLVASAPAGVASAPRSTPTQARLWLDQQLLTAGIKSIKVSEAEEQLLAQGSYGPEQKLRWIALQQAFDKQFGQQVMLHTKVVAHPDIATPRVRFQAVWFGPNPYVINDSGRRLYPGGALVDGWMLERIENNQVVLARGEERFTLTL